MPGIFLTFPNSIIFFACGSAVFNKKAHPNAISDGL